jgi:hypothetical protein
VIRSSIRDEIYLESIARERLSVVILQYRQHMHELAAAASSNQLIEIASLQPLSCIPSSATRRCSVLQLRFAQLESRREDLDRGIKIPLTPVHLPEVLRLNEIRARLQNRGVSSHNTFQHVLIMTKLKALVHLAEALLDGFGLETQTVEPDVVLGQAHVDVKGLVFFGPGEQCLDDCCSSY